MRIAHVLGLVGVLAVALTACVPAPGGGAEATVESIIDGDTITTSVGVVRIIGIDTPEQGVCGSDAATEVLEGVIRVGDRVTLELPDGQNDHDRYDRLLRYVTTGDGTDLALLQLLSGTAVARYDSSDGYPAHPREAAYHAAAYASMDADGNVLTAACLAAAAP